MTNTLWHLHNIQTQTGLETLNRLLNFEVSAFTQHPNPNRFGNLIFIIISFFCDVYITSKPKQAWKQLWIITFEMPHRVYITSKPLQVWKPSSLYFGQQPAFVYITSKPKQVWKLPEQIVIIPSLMFT